MEKNSINNLPSPSTELPVIESIAYLLAQKWREKQPVGHSRKSTTEQRKRVKNREKKAVRSRITVFPKIFEKLTLTFSMPKEENAIIAFMSAMSGAIAATNIICLRLGRRLLLNSNPGQKRL